MVEDVIQGVPATRVEDVLIAEVLSAEVNPNEMEPERFDLLVEAIKRLGFLQPILVQPLDDEDAAVDPDAPVAPHRWRVLDGHHRLRAAETLGYTHVPAVIRSSTSATDASVLQVGMNRLRGEVRLDLVAGIMAGLVADGFEQADLCLMGFTLSEVDMLLDAATPQTAEDVMTEEVTAPPEAPDPVAVVLEIPMKTGKESARLKRKLKKAGGGDMRRGLYMLFGEDPPE